MTVEIACSDFIARNADEATRGIRIRILSPEPDPLSENGDFRCWVELTGFSESRFVYGMDSLQSLCLAIEYVRKELDQFAGDGWSFSVRNRTRNPWSCFSVTFPVTIRLPGN